MSSPSFLFRSLMIIVSFPLLHLVSVSCNDCAPFPCKNWGNLSFPFSQDTDDNCGPPAFKLKCQGDGNPTINATIPDFRVIAVDMNAQSLTVARTYFRKEICSPPYMNYSLEYLHQGFFAEDVRLADPATLKQCCLPDRDIEVSFTIRWNSKALSECKHCMEDLGRSCAYNSTLQKSSCFCHDGAHCPKSTKNRNIIIGTASGVGVFVMAVVLCLICYRRKKYIRKSTVSRSLSLSSRTDSEEGSAYYGLPIFDYNELKRVTNNFDPAGELGDGGFGTVFKGKLRDGREVAVKRLYEHNYKRVEQFMNEVEILTRLRHPNLVSLYGCTSRLSHRLLLVYEYVSNGTVADHLHGERAKPGLPVWPTRLNIAVETAKALLYLHRSDIVHRDVKTNNILLDENFGVKVADFGLSRLFPLNVTHVSTAPQGTPGYVDPEYDQCYQLTEKSDVYSFGVVLMELISSLPAVDITRNRHDINLSAMAMNKIQSQALHELVDPDLGYDSDYKTGNMITAVAELGFQCLQQASDMRPSMEQVLEILNDIQNVEEADVPSDDAVPLKKNQLTFSPKSVTTPWSSDISTPNTSG